MLDMGFAEDLEAIFDATPDDAPDGALLARRCRRGSSRWRAATCATPSGSRSAARPRPSDGAPLVRQSAYIVARAHKPAALGRVLDVEAPDRGARLLPHARRGRPARRDAQRPRLPRRGAARRHDPGPARPRDGAPAQRDRGPDRRHRRRRPRPRHRPAHARRQLRRPVGPGLLHAPHRPRRPRGPRGRRDHAGRAARAPDAQDDRARRPVSGSRSRSCRPSPTCARAGWSSRAPRSRRPLVEGDLDRFRVVVDTLAGEHDVVEIALAAVKLAHEASGQLDDDEAGDPRGPPSARPKARQRQGRAPQHDAPVHRRRPRPAASARSDLVGAIAGESSVTAARSARSRSPTASRSSRSPTSSAQEVIAALRGSTIKGKKATVRRDRTAPPRANKRR